MKTSVMSVSAFLEAFNCWASAQPDVTAVALVGSYVRDAATEASDVDLLILTTDVAYYFGWGWRVEERTNGKSHGELSS